MVCPRAATWTSEAAPRLAVEVGDAIRQGLPLLLLHECDASKEGGDAPFALFLEQTPIHLVQWGIYSTIASSLYSGSHREISLALIARALAQRRVTRREPRMDLVQPQTILLYTASDATLVRDSYTEASNQSSLTAPSRLSSLAGVRSRARYSLVGLGEPSSMSARQHDRAVDEGGGQLVRTPSATPCCMTAHV